MSSRALPWIAAGLVAGVVAFQLASAPGESLAGVVERPSEPAQPAAPIESPSRILEPELAARRPIAPRGSPAAALQEHRASEAGEVGYQFDLLVLDHDDQPLSGAAVYLAPWPGPLALLGRTGVDGVVRARWWARRESMRVAFAAEHPIEGASSLRIAELTYRPFLATVELREFEGDAEPSSVWSSADARRSRLDEHGDLQFSAEITALPGGVLELPRGWSFPGAAQDPRSALPSDVATAHVFGVARESDGRIAPGARVRASARELDFELSTHADGSGAFHLGPLPREGAHLSVGGGEQGRYETELGFGVEPFQGVHASLQRGRELVVRCVDSVGRALAGWRVELTDAAPRAAWADVARTDALGRLRVANVPSAMLRIDLVPPRAGSGLPFAVWYSSDLAGERMLELPCALEHRSSIAFRVLDADGAPMHDALATVELLGTRRAVRAEFDATLGVHRARSLPAGEFSIVVTAPSRAPIVTRTAIELGSEADVDLGELRFARPGVLEVELPTHLDPVEAELFTDDEPALFLGAFRARGRWNLELPEGSYVLRTRHGSGERRLEFDVASGATSLLRVPR